MWPVLPLIILVVYGQNVLPDTEPPTHHNFLFYLSEEKANKEKQEIQRKMEEAQRHDENKIMEHQRRIMEENFRKVLEKETNERRLLQEQLQTAMRNKSRVGHITHNIRG